MSKFIHVFKSGWALIILMMSVLACNAPQPSSPQPVCTPPACAEDEVYHCPDECPGGCGTGCATPTPGASTPTSMSPTTTPKTLAPTVTLMAVCTPPACAGNEIYYCPDECPGGCGTQCATPTPASETGPAYLPTISYFTADRMTLVEGEEVTLSWEATGGTKATVQWVTHEAVMAWAPGPLNPNGDTVTIVPTGDSKITLLVENDAGTAEAYVQLTITCPYPWAEALTTPPPLASACPKQAIYSQAAQQSFENGFMIWVGAAETIYIFYYPQGDGPASYQAYTDKFKEGDPESDPSMIPPEGLYQPIRGFGLVWRENEFVRERLGWATAPEQAFQTWEQSYSGIGMHAYYTLLAGIDSTIYHLIATGSVWEVYAP